MRTGPPRPLRSSATRCTPWACAQSWSSTWPRSVGAHGHEGDDRAQQQRRRDDDGARRGDAATQRQAHVSPRAGRTPRRARCAGGAARRPPRSCGAGSRRRRRGRSRSGRGRSPTGGRRSARAPRTWRGWARKSSSSRNSVRVSSTGRAPRWTSRVDGSSARSAKRSAPRRRGPGPRAAQERAQARVQLAQGEGLDEVVVGARVEARDAVVDGVARGEQEHRHALARGPQPAGHLEPVDARHGDVEHHARRAGARPARRAPRARRRPPRRRSAPGAARGPGPTGRRARRRRPGCASGQTLAGRT